MNHIQDKSTRMKNKKNMQGFARGSSIGLLIIAIFSGLLFLFMLLIVVTSTPKLDIVLVMLGSFLVMSFSIYMSKLGYRATLPGSKEDQNMFWSLLSGFFARMPIDKRKSKSLLEDQGITSVDDIVDISSDSIVESKRAFKKSMMITVFLVILVSWGLFKISGGVLIPEEQMSRDYEYYFKK